MSRWFKKDTGVDVDYGASSVPLTLLKEELPAVDRFLAILKVIPMVLHIIVAIEPLVPGTGKGSVKLNMLLNTINAVALTTPEVVMNINRKDLDAAVTAVAAAAVADLNAAGVFKK